MKFARNVFIFFAFFSLLNLQAFASPGGGPGGNGGNRPGSRPAPRERTAAGAKRSPSSSSLGNKNDRARPSEASKDSKKSSSEKNDNPSGSDGYSASPSAPEFSLEPKMQPSQSENGGQNITITSAGNTNNSEIIFYRGARTISESDEFTLQNIKSERTGANEFTIEITFNQSVNPRSFTANSILVDGQEIPSKTKFTFNKKGDTIKVSVPSKNENFSLSIQNVESFDGTKIEPIQIDIKN